MPTIDTGIAYGVTRFQPLGEELEVLPLGDVDAAGAAADEDAGARLVRRAARRRATLRSRR